MPNHLGYFSLALYVASFICYARNLSAPNIWVGRLASLLLAGGIFVQYLSLFQRALALHTVPYDDLYGSMSLFAWLLGITYLGLELFHRQRSVGAFVTLLLVCWIVLLGVLTPRSLPVIGRRFGGRDHTTVLHAVRKIEDLIQGDKTLADEIELLKRMIDE